jgi:hypothetical protein
VSHRTSAIFFFMSVVIIALPFSNNFQLLGSWPG